MHSHHYWFLVGTALVIAELHWGAGALYLLALAVGAAAGGTVAVGGASLTAQLLVTAVSGGASVLLAHKWNTGRPRGDTPTDFEVGQPVKLESRSPLKVIYRGAIWDATPAHPDVDLDAPLVIEAMAGIGLRITNANP